MVIISKRVEDGFSTVRLLEVLIAKQTQHLVQPVAQHGGDHLDLGRRRALAGLGQLGDVRQGRGQRHVCSCLTEVVGLGVLQQVHLDGGELTADDLEQLNGHARLCGLHRLVDSCSLHARQLPRKPPATVEGRVELQDPGDPSCQEQETQQRLRRGGDVGRLQRLQGRTDVEVVCHAWQIDQRKPDDHQRRPDPEREHDPQGPAIEDGLEPERRSFVALQVSVNTVLESVPKPPGCHSVWKMSRSAARMSSTPEIVRSQSFDASAHSLWDFGTHPAVCLRPFDGLGLRAGPHPDAARFLAGAVVVSFSAYSYITYSDTNPSSGGFAMLLKAAYCPWRHRRKATTIRRAPTATSTRSRVMVRSVPRSQTPIPRVQP